MWNCFIYIFKCKRSRKKVSIFPQISLSTLAQDDYIFGLDRSFMAFTWMAHVKESQSEVQAKTIDRQSNAHMHKEARHAAILYSKEATLFNSEKNTLNILYVFHVICNWHCITIFLFLFILSLLFGQAKWNEGAYPPSIPTI